MSTVEITPWNTTSITTQTTTLVKSGGGVLGKLVMPTPVASATVKVYDSLTAAGRVLVDTITFTASPPVQPVVVELNQYATTGITVVTAGATMNVDVLYL